MSIKSDYEAIREREADNDCKLAREARAQRLTEYTENEWNAYCSGAHAAHLGYKRYSSKTKWWKAGYDAVGYEQQLLAGYK